MQLITQPEEILATMNGFMSGLKADPFNWQDWCLLMVDAPADMDDRTYQAVANDISDLLVLRDGVVVSSGNKQLFSIFYAPDNFNLNWIEQYFLAFKDKVGFDVAASFATVNYEHDVVSDYIKRFLAALDCKYCAGFSPTADVTHSVYRYNELDQLWPRTSAHRSDRSDKHIMIVDDDELVRCIISHTFKKRYSLSTAASVTEAVRKHIVYAPNIIFLDIDLPDYDGFELLHHLKHYDPDCKVVMFSGNHLFGDRLKAFSAGAYGFIAKPFHKNTFKHYIDICEKTDANDDAYVMEVL